MDQRGIHDKVCALVGALRTLKPALGSEEERKRRDLTVQMSQVLSTVSARCSLAIALVTLRYVISVVDLPCFMHILHLFLVVMILCAL